MKFILSCLILFGTSVSHSAEKPLPPAPTPDVKNMLSDQEFSQRSKKYQPRKRPKKMLQKRIPGPAYSMRIDFVGEGSEAEQLGLQVGDHIVSWNDWDFYSSESLNLLRSRHGRSAKALLWHPEKGYRTIDMPEHRLGFTFRPHLDPVLALRARHPKATQAHDLLHIANRALLKDSAVVHTALAKLHTHFKVHDPSIDYVYSQHLCASGRLDEALALMVRGINTLRKQTAGTDRSLGALMARNMMTPARLTWRKELFIRIHKALPFAFEDKEDDKPFTFPGKPIPFITPKVNSGRDLTHHMAQMTSDEINGDLGNFLSEGGRHRRDVPGAHYVLEKMGPWLKSPEMDTLLRMDDGGGDPDGFARYTKFMYGSHDAQDRYRIAVTFFLNGTILIHGKDYPHLYLPWYLKDHQRPSSRIRMIIKDGAFQLLINGTALPAIPVPEASKPKGKRYALYMKICGTRTLFDDFAWIEHGDGDIDLKAFPAKFTEPPRKRQAEEAKVKEPASADGF